MKCYSLKSTRVLSMIAGITIIASGLSAQTIFNEPFTGSMNWSFDSIVDPNNQIGGTDQLTYTFGGINSAAYLTKAFTVASATTAETGTIILSGSIDISSITFGTADYDKRNLITIQTSSGNKSPFNAQGSLFNLGLGGWNNSGEYSLGQTLSVRFGSGVPGQIGNIQPAGDPTYNFVSTITISGDDSAGWTIDASTDLTNDNGTLSMSSTYTRTDTGFNGLQSISGIQVGLAPDASPFATSPETLGSGVVALDSVNLSVAAVPEPAFFSISLAAIICGIAVIHRRRRQS